MYIYIYYTERGFLSDSAGYEADEYVAIGDIAAEVRATTKV